MIQNAEVEELRVTVEAERTHEGGLKALFAGLAKKVRDLAHDPATLEKFADNLEAKTGALSAAVVANVPPPAPLPYVPQQAPTSTINSDGITQASPLPVAPAAVLPAGYRVDSPDQVYGGQTRAQAAEGSNRGATDAPPASKASR